MRKRSCRLGEAEDTFPPRWTLYGEVALAPQKYADGRLWSHPLWQSQLPRAEVRHSKDALLPRGSACVCL